MPCNNNASCSLPQQSSNNNSLNSLSPLLLLGKIRVLLYSIEYTLHLLNMMIAIWSIGSPLISAIPVDPITGYCWQLGSVSHTLLEIVPVQQSNRALVPHHSIKYHHRTF